MKREPLLSPRKGGCVGDPMPESMRRLIALTEALPAPSGRIVDDRHSGMVDYLVNGGTCFGLGLLSRPDIAVQQAFMSRGTIFPPHTHDESREFLLLYSGRLNIAFERAAPADEKERMDGREVLPGGFVYFEPRQVHTVEAIEDSWMLGITIPRDKEYPDDGKK